VTKQHVVAIESAARHHDTNGGGGSTNGDLLASDDDEVARSDGPGSAELVVAHAHGGGQLDLVGAAEELQRCKKRGKTNILIN
jgi:hypothetical protein